MYTRVAMQWNINMQCGRHISSGTCANNVKCMYNNAHQFVNLRKFVWGIYIDIVVSYLHMK